MIEQILAVLSIGHAPFVLFLVWSTSSFVLALVRIAEYYLVQRVPSTRWFAAVNVCQSIALGIAAVLVAPHPLTDFEHLRPWSRLWWAIGLPAFLVAVLLHIVYVGRIIWIRHKVLIVGIARQIRKY